MWKFWKRDKLVSLLKSETVLIIAAAAAAASCCAVTPSLAYVTYPDYRVLSLLFCLMAVVCGLEKNGLFRFMAYRMLKRVKTLRGLSLTLISLCFFSSMIITNDVALLTFVPFAILVLGYAHQEDYIILVVVLQTIAANLGSMVTPIGNPQNLYLYTYFQMDPLEFLQTTGKAAVLTYAGLLGIHVFFPKVRIKTELYGELTIGMEEEEGKKYNMSILFYWILLVLCMATVLRLVDYRATLAIIVSGLLIFDREVLKKVDYGLLCTFVAFFIFVGNMKEVPLFSQMIGELMDGREVITAVGLSQVISNVPAAVLLSGFTQNGKELLLGVNMGGLGTLVASLASLISFKIYGRMEGAQPLQYIGVFTLFNLVFLIGLTALQ